MPWGFGVAEGPGAPHPAPVHAFKTLAKKACTPVEGDEQGKSLMKEAQNKANLGLQDPSLEGKVVVHHQDVRRLDFHGEP